jgi:uncharacterized surface protein with fasciclin (FAS1) repeats
MGRNKRLTKMKNKLTLSFAIFGAMLAVSALALMPDDNPMVGGMTMMKSKNIVENAMQSPDHTTLVAAVKAAGLVDTLMMKGPYTVFAPTNDAFENLPSGTVDMLLMPENKMMLTKVLTYHVVPGRMDFNALKKAIKMGDGMAKLKTVSGGWLWAMFNGANNIVIKDEKGMVASISTYDVYQSNGVIHVINRVLMPN